jgi:predicted N-acetyltransferase YhbS
MDIKLRTATPDDAQRCGTICFEAFRAIANQHGFPPDVSSAEVTIGLLAKMIPDPRFYAIVAEIDNQVVGSNFMDERSAIAGIGPITIDPTVQNRGIGRALMGDCMTRAQSAAFLAFASFKPVITPALSRCTRSWDSSRASHWR